MMPSFMERLRMWICEKFGHKQDNTGHWEHDGNVHYNCARCRVVVTAPSQHGAEDES